MHYHLHLNRADILEWEYYVFENNLTKLVDALKKKKDAEEGKNSSGSENNSIKMPSMPKMPSLPSFPKL